MSADNRKPEPVAQREATPEEQYERETRRIVLEESKKAAAAGKEGPVFQTEQSYRNQWRINNRPPDKELVWICEEDLNQGLYWEWQEYSPAKFFEDMRRYNTRIISRPKFIGDRVWLKKHWLVFMPKDEWNSRVAARLAESRALRRQVPEGMSSRERVMKDGRVVFEHTVDGKPFE